MKNLGHKKNTCEILKFKIQQKVFIKKDAESYRIDSKFSSKER